MNRVPKWIRDRIFNDAAQVSEMAVWIARVTQFANHFPLEDRYIRDSSADSSLRNRWVSTKRIILRKLIVLPRALTKLRGSSSVLG